MIVSRPFAALAQINSTVGDFAANADKIVDAARRAHDAGAALCVLPEMALAGYPAEDWLIRKEFCEATEDALQTIAQKIGAFAPELVCAVGAPRAEDGKRFNSLFLIQGGRIIAHYDKTHLPEYGVFDEKRLFCAGSGELVVDIAGVKTGFVICEDLWFEQTAQKAKKEGAQVLVSINASPYEAGKEAMRDALPVRHATAAELPLIYVNLTGGQDELVFDGASFATDFAGRKRVQLAAFEEDFKTVTLEELMGQGEARAFAAPVREEMFLKALICALCDYVRKNGFKKVILGLSGGADSALVAAVAVEALGKENVRAVMLPSRFTSKTSLDLAEQLAGNLGITYSIIPIEKAFGVFLDTLKDDFAGTTPGIAEENLQARSRGVILMALSNKTGALLLATGNKSELAAGYCTLYGDTAGAFAPLKDVCKTDVWELMRTYNRLKAAEVIPEGIITRPASAELREDQKDEDSLPPYEVFDRILRAYVEEGLSPAEIAAAGEDPALIERITGLIHRNEYKRRQCPVGPKVSKAAFGRDWRYPMTARTRFFASKV